MSGQALRVRDMFTTANPRGAMLLRVVAGLLSILLVLNEANAASADHESDDSRAAQAAFDRLMAIARKTTDQGTRASVALDTSGRPSLGSAEAPLAMIEFGSHGCAFCRRHWLKTMPGLRECYIDIGELHYVFIDVALVGCLVSSVTLRAPLLGQDTALASLADDACGSAECYRTYQAAH
jgi:hypothetical protein